MMCWEMWTNPTALSQDLFLFFFLIFALMPGDAPLILGRCDSGLHPTGVMEPSQQAEHSHRPRCDHGLCPMRGHKAQTPILDSSCPDPTCDGDDDVVSGAPRGQEASQHPASRLGVSLGVPIAATTPKFVSP